MKAIILAGGKGTRLRPLTNYLPKPMVPIIDKPILEYIILLLKRHGIKDIAVTLGYKSEKIVEYFGDGSSLGVRLTYFRESTPLGTAGAVKNAESYLDDDFVVMSGDALTNIDLTSLVDFHHNCGAMLTMASKRVKNPEGFGILNVDRYGKILSFVEKPLSYVGDLVNMGIYVANKEVLDYIPCETKFDFSHDLFPLILPYMYACFCDCYWSDIGTLSSYYLTNNYVVSNSQTFGISI